MQMIILCILSINYYASMGGAPEAYGSCHVCVCVYVLVCVCVCVCNSVPLISQRAQKTKC